MSRLLALLATAVLLATATPASAATTVFTVHMSASGTDTNDGLTGGTGCDNQAQKRLRTYGNT